ncbi:Uncharacterized protein Mb2734 [Linum perenne]
MKSSNHLHHFLSSIRRQSLRSLLSSGAATFPNFIATIVDTLFSLYFISCNIIPCTIDLDHDHDHADDDHNTTTLHFWISGHRHVARPSIVLIHGFGGNSRWQFYHQIKHLSEKFNIYIPDLLFFGKSHSSRTDRSIEFQAHCIREGLRKLGLERYTVVGLSYGGYVAYRMAEVYVEEVEKVVIISSGICQSKEEMEEEMKKLGDQKIEELLLPEKAEDVRKMVKLAMYKSRRFLFAPDFVLRGFIKETLLIWGEQDLIFPLHLAYQLQRHLGGKARVEVLKETGHGANIDSPEEVNRLITSFVSHHNPNSF